MVLQSLEISHSEDVSLSNTTLPVHNLYAALTRVVYIMYVEKLSQVGINKKERLQILYGHLGG